MRLSSHLMQLFTLLLVLLLSGCGNTYNVKEVTYSAPQAVSDKDVRIYVLREDSAFGGARKFSIINNDTIMGVLTPGTFTHYTVKSGENEVVAYMSPSPLTHLRISGRAGETVYVFCHMGYASGIYMEEIDEATARNHMQEFKYTEIDVKNAKAKMDYKAYYENLYR
jgi:hydrogenase maturation factor